MTSGAVLVATMHRDNEMAPSTVQCLLTMMAADAVGSGRVIAGGGPLMVPATPMSMHAVRNRIARALLDDFEAEWLLMIDADMGFEPDLADRLVDAADPVHRPVVGALCFAMQRGAADGMGGWRVRPQPTIYQYRTDEQSGESGFRVQWDYPENTVMRVGATGAAALLVHRDVFAKTRGPGDGGWFDRVKLTADGDLLGEDMSFCAKLAGAGVPVFVHTGAKTTHQRTVWVGEDDYLMHRTVAALSEQAQ